MADDERKTHIFRVIGKSPSGDVEGTWLDLERSEFYTLVEGSGPDYKRTNVKLKWYLDDAGKVPNPSRKTTMVKVIPPDEDKDNPQLWFEVDMVDAIEVRDDDQVVVVHFDNSADNRGRKVAVRRVVHMDTTADDRFPDGGVIPKDEYQKLKATKDVNQKLDIEIIQKRAFRDADQIYAIKYNNQPLIDAAELPDVSYGEGEVNPPWRFDPLQIPINIRVKTAQQWLLAISNWSRDNDDNASLHADVLAADGEEWPGALGGASGGGITVIGGAAAFGAITLHDGSKQSCFLACSTAMRDVKLGTIKNGGVSWQTVWSVEGDQVLNYVTAISYANGRFFITFMGGDIGESHCNVISTQDGRTFSPRRRPFPSRGNSLGPYGGAVVYEKVSERYVMVGDDEDNDDETEFGLAFSDGFCWATSSDGVNWSGRQINGVFNNPGGGGQHVGNVDATSLSTVAAGNGVIVGAASLRHKVFETITVRDDIGEFHEEDVPYVISSCAVAVSSNGATSWTTTPLPGADWRQDKDAGDLGGTTVSVVFVEDSEVRDSKGHTGYFVACGYEGSAPGFENAKLWKSIDGSTWTMIRSETHDVFEPGQYVALSAIDKTIKTVVFL